MQIQEHRHGAVMVVKPTGPLIGGDAEELRQRLIEVRKTCLGRFVLDMSQTPFVDSKGLEVLLDTTEAMGQSGQSLKLCYLNDTLREVLELTELAPLFEHFDDVNHAVRSFL